MERLSERHPTCYTVPFPDPPHNIKSVRSAMFWYWLLLDKYLVNIRILLVLRRDSNPLISLPMRKAVSLKALKNKDRMSVETAIEVLGPEVQRAIPSGPIVVTLISEVYTFWRQNRPGCIQCPVDVTVYEGTGRLFFTDIKQHQVMTSDFHSPSNVVVVAGTAGKPGMKDGARAHFSEPSGICIWETLLFVCDSSNGSVRVVDIEVFVSRGRRSQHVAGVSESVENMEGEDCDPAGDPKEKTAPVSTLELISLQRPAVCLQRPFAICAGRRMDKEYPDFYVTDTKKMCIFRIDDVIALEKAKLRGRLSQMTLTPVDKALFVPVSVQYIDLRLLVANSHPAKPEVLV